MMFEMPLSVICVKVYKVIYVNPNRIKRQQNRKKISSGHKARINLNDMLLLPEVIRLLNRLQCVNKHNFVTIRNSIDLKEPHSTCSDAFLWFIGSTKMTQYNGKAREGIVNLKMKASV